MSPKPSFNIMIQAYSLQLLKYLSFTHVFFIFTNFGGLVSQTQVALHSSNIAFKCFKTQVGLCVCLTQSHLNILTSLDSNTLIGFVML